MKHSIRKQSINKQLSLIFSAIFIAIIAICLLANMFFLRGVFLIIKYNVLKNSYEQINLAAHNSELTSQDFLLSLREICEKNNISALVLDREDNVLVSYQGNDPVLKQYLLDYFMNKSASNAKIFSQTGLYTIQFVTEQQTGFEYLEIIGELESGQAILLRSAMEGIKTSVKISNLFLSIVALIGILAGILAVRLASRKIIRPILQLTELSERMANLDFEAKYEGSDGNEIDSLGQNMNNLSEKLEIAIGDLKSANAELRKNIEKKEEQEKSRKEFIANASHELKTPIALIQGYAEGLKEGIIDDKESRDYYCEVIADEAAKMNELVKKLMSLNELEMGDKTVHIERFNINEMIINQLQTMNVLAEQQNATVVYDAFDYYVWSDEFKIEEVFRNYFTNAIHHVGGAGDGRREIAVILSESEDLLRVSVFNTGEQIPEDEIDKIWDKFYKVDKARTREYGGSGVGLSIVKATMELLGQNYGCLNKEDGVEFYFEVPLK